MEWHETGHRKARCPVPELSTSQNLALEIGWAISGNENSDLEVGDN